MPCQASGASEQFSHWSLCAAPAGWGNDELQCYTNSSSNIRVAASNPSGTDGVLVMAAQANPTGVCRNLFTAASIRNVTSGKVTTNGKRSAMWTGPRGASNPVMVTARIKLPVADKSWPAFWMLPSTDNTYCSGCGAYGGWCTSGEIDIMEHINADVASSSSIHYGGSTAVHYQGCLHNTGGCTLLA